MQIITGIFIGTMLLGLGFYADKMTQCNSGVNVQVAHNESSEAFQNMVKAMTLPVKGKN